MTDGPFRGDEQASAQRLPRETGAKTLGFCVILYHRAPFSFTGWVGVIDVCAIFVPFFPGFELNRQSLVLFVSFRSGGLV
jgi:hypothetical protein